jgi:hypothetical protein
MADLDCNGEADGFAGMAPYLWIAKNWRMYLHHPDSLEKFPVDECNTGHHASGIYFLWDVNGSLLYVGRSGSIGVRIFQHRCESMAPAFAFSYFPVEGYKRRQLYLDKIESAYIHALTPAFNTQYRNQSWELLDTVAAAVRAEWAEAHKHPPIMYVVNARGDTQSRAPYAIQPEHLCN